MPIFRQGRQYKPSKQKIAGAAMVSWPAIAYLN
jgi:hypothetical protein